MISLDKQIHEAGNREDFQTIGELIDKNNLDPDDYGDKIKELYERYSAERTYFLLDLGGSAIPVRKAKTMKKDASRKEIALLEKESVKSVKTRYSQRGIDWRDYLSGVRKIFLGKGISNFKIDGTIYNTANAGKRNFRKYVGTLMRKHKISDSCIKH